MSKATVLLDFDSTVIKGESFEMILMPRLEKEPELLKEVELVTTLGMSGEIPFNEAVKRKFSLASPTLSEIDYFIQKGLKEYITDGFQDLVNILKFNDIDIWIVSGGLKKVIEPFASTLGIPSKQVIALDASWNESGEFNGIVDTPACYSKISALKPYLASLVSPVIAVGDGYTDYQLFEDAIADYFVCYCEHVTRKIVLEKCHYFAESSNELLRIIMDQLINTHHQDSVV